MSHKAPHRRDEVILLGSALGLRAFGWDLTEVYHKLSIEARDIGDALFVFICFEPVV
jgi:hypothetical protein